MSVRKLYNQDAHSDNTFVVHKSQAGCCNGETDFCRFKVDAAITNVTAITLTINGNPEIVTFPAAANTPKEVRMAIAAALKTKGYDPYYDGDSWKGIIVSSTSISVIGEAIIASITVDGTAEVPTRLCTVGKVCKWVGTIAYDTDLGLMSVNGSAGTQIGTNAGFAAGATAGLKTALETALTAEGLTFQEVTITESAVNTSFTYELHVNGEPTIVVGTTELEHNGCYPEFISA